MRDLRFKIYIGTAMVQDQSQQIQAVLVLVPEVPRGHYNFKGLPIDECMLGFFNLSLLADYISDWIDLVGEENISSIIYLKRISQHKVFKGKAIVNIIDSLEKIGVEKIQNFKDSLEEKI